MQVHLDHLSKTPEVSGDELLVSFTKIARILHDLSLVSSNRHVASAISSVAETPPAFFTKSLKMNLEAIKKDISPHLTNNSMFGVLIYSS